MSDWWNKGTDIPLRDKTFCKIVNFYLFHCPCEIRTSNGHFAKVSHQGVTFREKGWIYGYVNTLTSCMKKGSSNRLVYNCLDTNCNIEEETKKIEETTPLSDKHFEMITILKHPNMNIPSSIFYYIRNAFAHGKVKAQLRLRQETLLEWIKDFTLSPNELRKILQVEKKNNKKKRKVA